MKQKKQTEHETEFFEWILELSQLGYHETNDEVIPGKFKTSMASDENSRLWFILEWIEFEN